MPLTTQGLVVPRLADLRETLRARARELFGDAVDTGPEGPVGQFIDAFSKPLSDVLDLAQQEYDAKDPNAASGAALDALAAWNRITREGATKSTVVLTLTGDAGTPIPAGSVARIPNGSRWITLADATIGGGGTVDVSAEAEESGVIEASAGTITERVTAITGWDAVTNAAAAVPGRSIETDAELRARRAESLLIAGGSTDQSLRSKLEQRDDVLRAAVISNRTNVTDALGIPGHAFRVVVWPATADAAEIAELIWSEIPSGSEPDGTQSAIITDSQGYAQTVKWSWATELELYLEVIVTTTAKYPADGDTQVAAALEAAFESLSVGDDVVLLEGICEIMDNVPGVVGLVLRAKFGSVPAPSDTSNLTVELTQIATLDGANITVSSS